jgi:prepilin-type N-terminal cleavage/methylation domain-containing protein
MSARIYIHSCKRSRRAAGQAGMTLIEVLIAMAILAFMMAIAWVTTTSSATAKKRFENVQERNHEIRVAMATMARDFSSAYVSGNEPANLDNPRTLLVAKSRSPVGEIRFSSLGHRVLWADANESEQTLISYSAEPDRDEPGKNNLLRREARRLSYENWENEPADVDILLRDIERVEFEYWNWRDNEWQEHWDTTKTDAEKGRLPERVRITLTVKNSRGDQIKRTTQARIEMLEMVQAVLR